MTNSASPSGRIVIAGGTGFLGLNLARYLADLGCEIVLISRRPPAEKGEWIHALWDGRTLGNWAKHLDGAAALVNLAGRSVDCIKTPDHCDEMLRSRVEATRVLGHALQNVQTPPPVWVQIWIHEEDMNRLFVRAIASPEVSGAYLATAPRPILNAEFMRTLRKVLRAPFGLPAASWMVRLGAPLVMRTDPELALYGRSCVSRRLREEGFDFTFPDLASALQDIYGSSPKSVG